MKIIFHTRTLGFLSENDMQNEKISYAISFSRRSRIQIVKCTLEIKTSLFSFLLLSKFIVDIKVPIWVGLVKKSVIKAWVVLGTCILKKGVLKGWHKGTHAHNISLERNKRLRSRNKNMHRNTNKSSGLSKEGEHLLEIDLPSGTIYVGRIWMDINVRLWLEAMTLRTSCCAPSWVAMALRTSM